MIEIYDYIMDIKGLSAEKKLLLIIFAKYDSLVLEDNDKIQEVAALCGTTTDVFLKDLEFFLYMNWIIVDDYSKERRYVLASSKIEYDLELFREDEGIEIILEECVNEFEWKYSKKHN